MPYTKAHNPWVDYPGTSTPILAADLDHIEDGIVTAQADAEAAAAALIAGDAVNSAALAAHIADAVAAHQATAVAFTPAGTISATTVQAAIEEAVNEFIGVSGIPGSVFDAKGELIGGTGNDTYAIVPAATADGMALVSDSAQATGMAWGEGGGNVDWVVNVEDFGALADDATDNTAFFQAAIDSITATGGMVVIPPGTYRGAFSVTANVPYHFIGYGAKIRPLASTKAFVFDSGNGDTAAGHTLQGVAIDGSLSATSTTGVYVEDTDRVRILDVRVDDCSVGIEFKVSTTGEWVEGCAVKSSFVSGCVKGIYFNGTGTSSFSECVLLDTGVQGCTTGIETAGGNSTVTNRMFLGGVTVWVSEGQKAVQVATSMKGAQWNLGLESFATTAATGVQLATGTINADLWDITLDFVGTFSAKTVILAGQDLVYRTSTADVRMGGTGTGGRGIRAYQGDTEAFPRVEIGGGFSGGGGLLLGAGSSPDVQLYRNAAGILESNVQFYGVGGLTTKALSAAPTDADILNDLDGSILLDETNNRLYVRSNGVWLFTPLSATVDGIQIYDRVTATTDVTSTAAETTLYTKSIAANAMSSNKMLRLKLVGDFLYNNSSGDTMTLRLKFGGTTWTTSPAFSPGEGLTNASRGSWEANVTLMNLGVTNSQKVSWHNESRRRDGGNSTGRGQIADLATLAAEDTTSAKTLLMSAQWSASSSNNSWRLRYALLELI